MENPITEVGKVVGPIFVIIVIVNLKIKVTFAWWGYEMNKGSASRVFSIHKLYAFKVYLLNSRLLFEISSWSREKSRECNLEIAIVSRDEN